MSSLANDTNMVLNVGELIFFCINLDRFYFEMIPPIPIEKNTKSTDITCECPLTANVPKRFFELKYNW